MNGSPWSFFDLCLTCFSLFDLLLCCKTVTLTRHLSLCVSSLNVFIFPVRLTLPQTMHITSASCFQSVFTQSSESFTKPRWDEYSWAVFGAPLAARCSNLICQSVLNYYRGWSQTSTASLSVQMWIGGSA